MLTSVSRRRYVAMKARRLTPSSRSSSGEGPHPEDRWYALLDGEWVRVPPDKIVTAYAPDGRAYIFVMYGVIQCFVRPRGGL
jgi:hypothetical protein